MNDQPKTTDQPSDTTSNTQQPTGTPRKLEPCLGYQFEVGTPAKLTLLYNDTDQLREVRNNSDEYVELGVETGSEEWTIVIDPYGWTTVPEPYQSKPEKVWARISQPGRVELYRDDAEPQKMECKR